MSGDHVAPFMLNGNPAVAWCTFEQSVVDAVTVLKGSLSWTARAPSGWTKPSTIKDVVSEPLIVGKEPAGTFALRVRPSTYTPQMLIGGLALDAPPKLEVPELVIYYASDRAIYSGGGTSFAAMPKPALTNTAAQTDAKPVDPNRILLRIRVRAVNVYASGFYNPIPHLEFKLLSAGNPFTPSQIRPRFALTQEERNSAGNSDALGAPATAGAAGGDNGAGYKRSTPNGAGYQQAVTDENGQLAFTNLYPPRVEDDSNWFPIAVSTHFGDTDYNAVVDLPDVTKPSDISGTYEIELLFRIDGGADPGIHASDEAMTMHEVVSVTLLPHSSAKVATGVLSNTLGMPHGMYSWGSGYRGQNNSDSAVRDGGAATDLALLGRTVGDVYIAVATIKDIALGDLRAIYYQDDQLSTWISHSDQGFQATTDGSFVLREIVYSGLQTERLWSPEVQSANDGGSYWSLHAPQIQGVNWSPQSITTEAFYFDSSVPFSIYNWELFYHLPSLIADHLSKQQRFSDADLWLRRVFDPMTTEAADPKAPDVRFWRFLPFRRNGQPQSITDLLNWLASPSDDSAARDDQQRAIDEWKDDPFNPHEIARVRTGAYQWRAVISYITNLLDWADQLFARDSREAINEAVQLYVLAGQILGPRPKRIERTTAVAPLTYRTGTWDANFSNDWEPLADHLVLGQAPGPSSAFEVANATIAPATILGGSASNVVADTTHAASSLGLPYFCIPANDDLLSLWDRTADRLLKIRLGQNIEGLARDLALFDPPIDPELLVRATAAGLDVSDILNGLSAPPPTHRFAVMMQKAMELCNEVKALGGMLLSVLEKGDAEALSNLRAVNEVALLRMVAQLRLTQLTEAQDNTKTLQDTRRSVEDRFKHLQGLLGRPDVVPPAEGVTLPMESSPLQLAQDGGLSSDNAGLGMVRSEQDQIARLIETHVANTVAAGMNDLVPFLVTAASFIPVIDGTDIGKALVRGASALKEASTIVRAVGEISSGFATRDAMFSSFQRRKDDWIHQSNQAVRELAHIDQQVAVSKIHEAIAQAELDNTNEQINQASAVADFLQSKFTNQELYSWMQSQIATVYFQTYRLAHDVALRAEASFNYELTGSLTPSSAPFIQPGYWDSLKRGLLAGEQLSRDLKQMDSAYLERNKREFEITKHVSLRRLNPQALKDLREKGWCDLIEIPEWLFDLDCPGHYLRRLRAVSITIPCVVGPYTGVFCKLTLRGSAIRYADNTSYPLPPLTPSGLQPALLTSSGNNDGGLFETNLRDERYLPFEGSGAVSLWKLELTAPTDLAPFDYSTIPDVIFHLRFTARDGDLINVGASSSLADECTTYLDKLFRKTDPPVGPQAVPLVFTARADFPTEWAKAIASPDRLLSVTVDSDYVPYWARQFSLVSGSWIDPKSDLVTGALPCTFEVKLPPEATDAWLLLALSRSAAGATPRAGPVASASPKEVLSLSSDRREGRSAGGKSGKR